MKTFIVAIALCVVHALALAQEKSDPNHRFAVGLLGHYHTENHRLGLSGQVKWLLPTQHPAASRFLFTAKVSHTAPSNGSFFTAFDDGKYDNISAAYLMIGHRINWFDKRWRAAASDPAGNNTAYLELNVGAGYNGHLARYGLGLNPVIGYSFNQRFELSMAYQGLFVKKGYANLNLLEVGLGYRF